MSTAAKRSTISPEESDDDENDVFHDARFPPSEEAHLLTQSNTQKSQANKLFSSARYSEAITIYDHALSFCPNYLDFEIAVLRSNIAACHLKLENWKAAVDAATTSIECLNRIFPSPAPATSGDHEDKSKQSDQGREDASAVIELDADGDEEDEAEQLRRLNENDTRKEDVKRIRAKALMRRARAKMELGGWANLQGAETDYKELIQLKVLPRNDELMAIKALSELPAKINIAREKEVGDMMGKLKDLGNGILKPFGLSTENFKFIKDENTGGYNIAFEK
ncbi:predicted protein [Uncinocarpus reesii 1704]|uniref:Tetratricopeptide repeat protein 1 n=1 Tax=Uncinocarpus reesii (strain UAMH 1704) TaxID=336963 RepID=C4JPW1_UNCRE|nr:uncharacterized protein UREG_04604 [Uncinocarpus reesii 1704]EEP79758.1 predicted protein [Uncinocarpus reesii 1704]